MQVIAFATPASVGWRWRIVNYVGEMVEESYGAFPTITAAVAAGALRLREMEGVHSRVPANAYSSPSHLRGRPATR